MKFWNMNEIKNIPEHVSIIMDGNGRWARQRGLERVSGHFNGVESVRACVEAAAEAGVRYLSLFAFFGGELEPSGVRGEHSDEPYAEIDRGRD